MAYVEWLRVRNTLKVLGIVLGALFALALVMRLATLRVQYDSLAWVTMLQKNAGSHVTQTWLPDGTQRIVIDNPKDKVHVVMLNRGYRGIDVTVTDRSATHHYARKVDNTAVFGVIRMTQHRLPGGGVVMHVRTNGSVEFSDFLVFGGLLALIVASILGSAFAKENDGHLELAFTKPISRVALGLQTMAVDVAGILLAIAAGAVLLVATQALFMVPRISFGTETPAVAALVILSPIAWYAMLAAATASLQRGYGAVVGFAWPVALGVVGGAAIRSHNALLILVRDVARVVGYIDPISYMHPTIAVTRVAGTATVYMTSFWQSTALVVLIILYAAAALWQWRRVEA